MLNVSLEGIDREAITSLLKCRMVNLKESADINMFVITPKYVSFAEIARIVEYAIAEPEKTYVCFLEKYDGEYFGTYSWSELTEVRNIVIKHNAKYFDTLHEMVDYIKTSRS